MSLSSGFPLEELFVFFCTLKFQSVKASSFIDKKLGSGDLSPSTDRMLNRVKSVYLFIRRQGVVTTKELVEEFDMTQRTMQRDLNILTYNDLVESPRRGQWTVTNKKVKVS